jgi:hypothetical protein
MSAIGDALGGVLAKTVVRGVGELTGANEQARAAERAANLQSGLAQQGIDVTNQQFAKLVELMSPFVTRGSQAIGQQGALIGLDGADAQRQAIGALETSPQMQAMLAQGENALLQNASATGGLRGGNIQAALAQFRPQLLSQMIQNQYQNLGGLSQLGQAAAAGQASSGMQSAASISDLLGQQGSALAGGVMAKGGAQRAAFGDVLNLGNLALRAQSGGVF